jgi:hypothetical protein
MGTEKPKADLLPGTLDMMVLKILTRGHLHGYAIAQLIQQLSDDLLRVEEGSLYPALQRLEMVGSKGSGVYRPAIAGLASTRSRRTAGSISTRKLPATGR